MNTFEKMLFLKSLSIFQFVHDEVLLELAAALEEQIVKGGEPIIQKGTVGTEMYMIVTGRVKVHDGPKLIKELPDHQVFGELSALSPEKRIADVSAIEETLLLKINHQTIYDLMAMRIDLSKGLIEMLCQKIRSMSHDYIQKDEIGS